MTSSCVAPSRFYLPIYVYIRRLDEKFWLSDVKKRHGSWAILVRFIACRLVTPKTITWTNVKHAEDKNHLQFGNLVSGYQGPVSISDKTSYCKISQSLEVARFVCRIVWSFWNLTAHQQHCCRDACQISKRCHNSNYQSRGFETWRNLTRRRLIRYWNRAQNSLLQDCRGWNLHFCHLGKTLPLDVIYIGTS